MKNLLKNGLISAIAITFLNGCVVYARPAVYAYRECDVYDGPCVVYYHSYYHGGYYYHRSYCR